MKNYKSLAKLIISVLLTVSMLSFLSWNTALAQSLEGKRNVQRAVCTNQTLKGAYGMLTHSGVDSTQPPASIPFAIVRTANFDGNGKVNGRGVVSTAGDITGATISGTYKVENDCTVIMNYAVTLSNKQSIPNPSEFGVIIDGGRKIFAMETTSGQTETRTYERIN